MKKLLYLTNIPSPYRVEFWNELGKYYELTVWFEAHNEKNREWKIEGLGQNFKYEFLNSITLGLDNHFSLQVLKKLQHEPFDVYILGCYASLTEMLAILWFKFRNKAFFLNSDGGFPKEEATFTRRIKTFFISAASEWLSSGKNCTEYLQYYGAKADRIFEYPFASVTYGLPEGSTDDARNPSLRKQFLADHGLRPKVILTAGQFIHRKGIDVLIRAFQRLKAQDTSLVIVGSGPEEMQYQSLIAQSDQHHVVFQPFLTKEELGRYYQNSDVFVLPTRYDIWGLVLNEAMAFGLPVIATQKCGAAYDLIEEGENGYIVPVEDEVTLAARLEELLADAEKRAAFGRRSREIIAAYSIEKMAAAHVQYIEHVAERGGLP